MFYFPLLNKHGRNIHFVDNNENEMKKAVSLLMNDPLYRKKLEDGANAYWNEWGTPVKSLELLGIKRIE